MTRIFKTDYYNHRFFAKVPLSMKLLKKSLFGLLVMLLLIHKAMAASGFVVQGIRVEGLQGLSPATVISYMPIKVGQTLEPGDTSTIITALYETGFFSNVELSRDGNILIVIVEERPTIADIKVTGNSSISTDQINSVLKNLGLVQGQVLNQSILDEVTKSIESAYYLQGHYNATVNTVVTPTTRNRVDVNINISEGRVALVQKIIIIGNHAYSEKTLINQLTITTPKWDSWVTRNDHYSKDNLNDSLQALSNYYLDHGYLHFKIDAVNAVLAPDRKSVYVIIHVTEGPQYRLSGYNLTGDLVVPQSQLEQLPALQALHPGMVFSRKLIVDATNQLTKAFGDQGYAFADVDVVPNINEQDKTVFVSFHINPGNRIYVRRITFTGNTKTSDDVLRNAMRQYEGALISTSNVTESERQLNLLGYFQNVHSTTTPVPGSQNQADLNYSVTELPSAQATVGAGYGTDGFVLNAGVNESNFLGTGDQVGVNFLQSEFQRSYSFSFNNPYFTPDGVQRGFSIYNTKTTPGNLNLAPYDFTQYGANMTYVIPFSATDSYTAGIGLQRTTLQPGVNPSLQIQRFFKAAGQPLFQGTMFVNGQPVTVFNGEASFNDAVINLGWTRNGLDRALFPTDGTLQSAGAQISTPLAGQALDYYKLSYQIHSYHPLPFGFDGALVGSFGYGNGYGVTAGLPFFTNYYAGGLGYSGQVRGYETNALGPRDSNNQPIGGNALMVANADLFLPGPLTGDTYRTSLFVDAGNVYTTWNMYNTYPHSVIGVQPAQLRYSTGIDLQWRLPVLNAILELALAKPLDNHKQDYPPFSSNTIEPFSFNIGGTF